MTREDTLESECVLLVVVRVVRAGIGSGGDDGRSNEFTAAMWLYARIGSDNPETGTIDTYTHVVDDERKEKERERERERERGP